LYFEYAVRHDRLHRVGVPCDPEPDAQEEPERLSEEELRFIDWLADEAVKEWLES
jgi:hypothetical protein